MRLLSYNVRYGGTGREDALAAVIRWCDPDIVLLQEATDPRVVEKLSTACGLETWNARRRYSLAFLSRVPVVSHAWHKTPLAKRHFLEVQLGTGARVFGVHLAAIHSNVTELRRVYELKSLLRFVERYRDSFHLLTGDFNTLAPGAAFYLRSLPRRLRAIAWLTGGAIRWRTIRLMLDAGYFDAYRGLHPEDDGFTFPTWSPHVRLDYAFVPAAFAGRIASCEIVRDAPGVREASDHFPLLTEIRSAPVQLKP